MTQIYSHITGIGSYLPSHIVTNSDLAERIETSDSWIRERTGITQRHIAADDETTSDLGFMAAQRAIADAGLTIDEIDLIVVATTTPDYTFPAVATLIQERLGMRHGAAFDIQAVCSGFIYGLHVVEKLVRAGGIRNAVIIGAETFSRILDWEDRSTCVLFGDGAGAAVVSAKSEAGGVLSSFIRSDGRYRELLYVDGGPSKTKTVGHVRMVGNQVFKHAVTDIAAAMRQCAEDANIAIADIDWFVPHQANQRILNGVAKKLSIPTRKVISSVALHANTSAASVPLALDCAIKDGRIKKGDRIMLEAFGGGFTWGAVLFDY